MQIQTDNSQAKGSDSYQLGHFNIYSAWFILAKIDITKEHFNTYAWL